MRDQQIKTLALLYLSKFFQLVFPLLLTLIAARRLGRAEFGYLVLTQAVAGFASAFIEYGFMYTGAREASQLREHPSGLSRVFTEVSAAKAALALLVVPVSLLVLRLLNVPPEYWWGGVLLQLSLGFNPLWYYQGVGEVTLPVALDTLSKLAVTVVVWLYIDGAASLLAVYGGLQVVSVAALHLLVVTSVGVHRSRWPQVWRQLAEGYRLFVFRIGAVLYGGGSVMVLGLVAPPAGVALYGAADRAFRAAAALTAPIGDSFFANLTHQLRHDPPRSRRTFRLAATLTAVLCAAIFVGGEVLAGPAVRLLYGEKYLDAAPLLRILLLSVPLIGLGTVLFVLYLLPRGQDAAFARATLLAGLWTVGSAWWLVPSLGIPWMAYTVVIAEVIICLCGVLEVFQYRRRTLLTEARA